MTGSSPDNARSKKATAIVVTAVLLVVSATFVVVSGGSPNLNGQSQRTTVDDTNTSVQTTETKATATILPTPTATATPTATLTPTATATPTPTATPGPNSNKRYYEFVSTVFGEAEVDAEVPLRIRGWRVVENQRLIVVMNLTSRSEDDLRRAREVNTFVTSGYAQAVAHYDAGRIGGKIPSQLRIAEVNNTGNPPKLLYVNTSLARKHTSYQIDVIEFSDRYWDTERNMTASEQELVDEMDRDGGNSTLHNETR